MVTGNLPAELCHDFCIEPFLQTIEENLDHATANQEDYARSDIKASGFGDSPASVHL